jgi:SAM-dependent methyltransferase
MPKDASWRSFWDGEHAIYVSARHKQVHYAAIADGILAHLAALPMPGSATVLDYACGEALEADRVAAASGRLVLCDGAPSVVRALNARYGGRIPACEPEGLGQVIARGSIDLIVICSLVQYLTPADTAALLVDLAGYLKPGGRLVLADVITPEAGIIADVSSLIGNGLRHGYAVSALKGLVVTALSPYARMRGQLGLTRFTEADVTAMMRAAGLAAHRHRPNLGLTAHRMTMVGVRD